MNKCIGYVAEVIECEAGWGQRPDGYIVCLDKQAGFDFAKRENGKVWCSEDGSVFSIASDFKLCALTETGHENITDSENKRLWIFRSELNKYIKEV